MKREAWVVLLDGQQREISARVPVVVGCDPHDFVVDPVSPQLLRSEGSVRWVRVIDMDGTYRDAEVTSRP